MDGSDAGRDARPDRPSRRRFRPRLRLDERTGHAAAAVPAADACPRALNPVSTFIPVAAVSDMLLHPGEPFDYNGRRLTYPDIKLRVLGRRQPVSPPPEHPPAAAGAAPGSTPSSCTTRTGRAMAKHADIVVPSTTSFERDDYSGSAQRPAADGDARSWPSRTRSPATTTTRSPRWRDRLGFGEQFTEGRTARQWLRTLYEKWSAELDFEVPTFDEFWRAGRLRLPTEDGLTLLADFRADPVAHRLGTPSGRIEIFSADIDGFGYDDCAGHPTWYEPTEWLGGAARAQLSAAPAGQPARHPPAQPARRRRAPARTRKCKGANRSGCIRPTRGPRACRRRRGAGVQRPRRVPGRRGASTTALRPRRGAAVDGRVVRPGGPGRPGRACACTAIRTC